MARARGVVILEWRKKKPPSPAQLRALGRLPPGAYRVNPGGISADDRFIEYARSRAGLSREEAERALAVYKREKLITIDRVYGTFAFKHGAFGDPAPLRRAAALPKHRNDSNAEREYERFHWGTKAKRKIRVRVSTPRELFEIGKLRRVEYETVKKGERAVWYHDFSRPFPSLTATTSGRLGPIVGGRAKVEPRGIVG